MKTMKLEVAVLVPDNYVPKNAEAVLDDLEDRNSEVNYLPGESRILGNYYHRHSITVKEFYEQVEGARNLVEDLQSHEVEVQIHDCGELDGSEFVVERVGYKFSPWRVNYDETKGALIIDLKRR